MGQWCCQARCKGRHLQRSPPMSGRCPEITAGRAWKTSSSGFQWCFVLTAHVEALWCAENSGGLHRVTGRVNSLGLLDARGSKTRPALPIASKCKRKCPNIRKAMSFALLKQLWKKMGEKGGGREDFFLTF